MSNYPFQSGAPPPPPPPRQTRPVSFMPGDDTSIASPSSPPPPPRSPGPQASPPLPPPPQSPSAYNPAAYAPAASTHLQSMPVRTYSAAGPRPYNPAAYHTPLRPYGSVSGQRAHAAPAYVPAQYSPPPPPPAHSTLPTSPHSATSPGAPPAGFHSFRAAANPSRPHPATSHAQYSPSLNQQSPNSYGSYSPQAGDRGSPGFFHSSAPHPYDSSTYTSHRTLPPTPENPDVEQHEPFPNLHPHSRPLPHRPHSFQDDSPPAFDAVPPLASPHEEQLAERMVQDALFDEVEAVLLTTGRPLPDIRPRAHRQDSSLRHSYDSTANGAHGDIYDDYLDDQDAEAAGGVMAMEHDEEAYQARVGRQTLDRGPAPLDTTVPASRGEPASAGLEADFVGVDMSSMGGGWEMNGLAYGEDPESLLSAGTTSSDFGRAFPSTSSGSTQRTQPLRTESLRAPTFNTQMAPPARVNDSAVGGLSDPATSNRRRLSFESGDEQEFHDYLDAHAQSPDEARFAHGGANGGASHGYDRPLPPPPPSDDYPDAPYDYDDINGSGIPHFPRSISLNNPPSGPVPPATRRANTDAEERKRQTMMRASQYGTEGFFESQQGSAPADLDLPSLPAGKRFQPSKLTQRDYNRCLEPWALSSLLYWLRWTTEGETELRKHTLTEAMVNLFTYKIPNINIADAETLGALVIQEFEDAGLLVQEEEWMKLLGGEISGVLYQLTGEGCYSRAVHSHSMAARCYSHHCQRTVRKLAIVDPWARQPDWVTFYGVTKEMIEHVPKKIVELQNNLHEVVTSEESYMGELNVISILYRDALSTAEPSVIPPKKLATFIDEVFGKISAIEKANDEHLLPQLRYRQKEQGPFVKGFSDIFRSWIRKARNAYIEYAASFPHAVYLMKHEINHNMMFASFCEGARSNRLSNRLDWYSFLKAPITRLQRYGLLLSTAHKNMKEESDEKTNLAVALEEIKTVTLECDSRVAEGERKADLQEIASKIRLRKEMKGVELGLEEWGRSLFMKGDLQRMGTSRFTWLETHALLFDNYFVLSKMDHGRDAAHLERYEVYDVSKMPIPMDLLILESVDDDAVVRSSVKGVSTVTSAPGRVATTTAAPTSPSPATNGLNKTASHQTVTNLEAAGGKAHDEKILYPFRVRHLGKELFTLYCPSAQVRKTWCDKIIEAKTKHAASLFAQNAEPFNLRIIADHSFAYDSYAMGQKSVMIKGTPLSRAIEDVDRVFAHTGRPAPTCRARANCATTFLQPHGRQMILVGTDYGVYVTEAGNARGWTRIVNALKVTQAAVLEDFNLLVVISDKALIAYHLDLVCPPSTSSDADSKQSATDSLRRAPQKLSGARDVGFFTTARLKDRALVFYKKRDGLSSVFKVLEPVYQKSTEKRSRFHIHHRGNTDSFRDYDDFYIGADTRSINVFSTTIAVASAKGFEVLNLEKKQASSVPDLKQAHVATIAARLQGVEPVAMFKLDETSAAVAPTASTAHARHSSVSAGSGAGEFLCVYEECAVYINKYGDISRSVVLEFVGRAREACLVGGYLVLFDQDFVEVRNALNGNLKQVIAGKDVRCLDNGRGGMNGARTIKFALQHPDYEKSQLIVEMVLAGVGRGSNW